MTRANELATTRRRFTAECKARVAMEALRGDRTIQANRGQAPKCIRTRPAVRSAKPGIGWVHSLVVVASGSLQVGLIDLLPSDEGSRRSKSSQKAALHRSARLEHVLAAATRSCRSVSSARPLRSCTHSPAIPAAGTGALCAAAGLSDTGHRDLQHRSGTSIAVTRLLEAPSVRCPMVRSRAWSDNVSVEDHGARWTKKTSTHAS